MIATRLPLPRLLLLVCSLLAVFPPPGARAAAIWTNAASGYWHQSFNWANGNLPSLSGVYVTNAGTKTVTVDANAPSSVLFVNSLNLWAPPNATNTLWVADVGETRSLVVSNATLDVRMRGALVVTNASLVVTSAFANSGVGFNFWAGDVTLESGSIQLKEPVSNPYPTMYTRVGRSNLAVLTINGGFMRSSMFQVGQAGLPTARSHGIVRMNGGLLTVPGELSIGTSAGCTGLVEMAGGQIIVMDNLTNITRIGDQGRGRMIVSNAHASLGNISVGRHNGSDGELTVLAGGLLEASDDLTIGRFGNSTGRVAIAGGTVILTNHPIWVGREGRGSLVISNGLLDTTGLLIASALTNTASGSVLVAGGTVLATENVLIGAVGYSAGELTVSGGSLVISNADQTALLDVRDGRLNLDGGQLAVDRLVLTNVDGLLQFRGGTLQSSGTIVSNGQPFVLGDGTNAAVLELRGGTHLFTDGLVISPNATLTGCGIIIGTILNEGINSMNCDGPGLPPFILQHPVRQTVSAGNPVSFSVLAASGTPMTYLWRWNGSPIPDATSDTYILAAAQASDAGRYDVIVSNDSGSTTSRVATLTLATSPVITTQPVTQTIAQNSPVTFEVAAAGTGPLAYQWVKNSNSIAGATAPTHSIASAQAADAGDYQVIVSNPAGSVTSAVATLQVLSPPVITTQPVSQLIPSNTPVTFSATADGSPTLLYQWRFNGTAIPGANETNFSLAAAQLTNAGNYTVVVRNPIGSVTSAVANLSFQGAPIIITQPASRTNARNTSVTFSVVASGNTPLSYRWRFNNNNISGATSSSYTINNIGNGNAGNYSVIITNSLGAVTSQVAVLTVMTAVSISTQPTSQSITQGITAALRVTTSGSSPIGYQWRYTASGQAEIVLPGATNATLTLTNPQPSQAGGYRVVASNPVSAVTSQVATITVLVPPAITQHPQGLSVQPGSNVTFSVTATGPSLTYRWRKNAIVIPGATASTLALNDVQGTDAGSYSVIVSNTVGVAISAPAVLQVLVSPEPLSITTVGSTTSVSFPSQLGLSYTLEYKDTLDLPAWTPLGSSPGNGGMLTLMDPAAPAGTRFYRVRVE